MKVLRSIVLALAVGAAAVSTAQAHDSFSVGVNIGGYGPQAYPVVAYQTAPHVVYHQAPRAYYPARYAYYGAPVAVHRDVYYGGPRHHFRGHEHYRGYVQHGGYGHGHHGGHR